MKERKSNIELLRIISMLLIISTHLFVVSGVRFSDYGDGVSRNEFIAQIMGLGGKLGNTIFIVITGYFGINAKNINEKILKLINQTHFYAVIMLILTLILGISVSKYEIVKSIFPIFTGSYWFITVYVCLLFFSPFINLLLHKLTKENFIKLILGLFILTTILPITSNTSFDSVGIYDFDIFVLLYIIGFFFRKYPLKQNSIWYLLITSLLLNIIMIISVLDIDIMSSLLQKPKLLNKIYFFNRQQSPLLILCGVSVFLFFEKIELKQNIIINSVSKTVLGVYLIHGNIFFHRFFYTHFLKFQDLLEASMWKYLFHGMTITLVIFLICSLIEYLRQKLFLITFLNNFLSAINNKIINITSSFFKRL